jgi:hypothetical protein
VGRPQVELDGASVHVAALAHLLGLRQRRRRVVLGAPLRVRGLPGPGHLRARGLPPVLDRRQGTPPLLCLLISLMWATGTECVLCTCAVVSLVLREYRQHASRRRFARRCAKAAPSAPTKPSAMQRACATTPSNLPTRTTPR